jgi:hypothetical protein
MHDIIGLALVLAFILVIGLLGWLTVHESKPRRDLCTLGSFMCIAFRWPSCSDGRCRYHCSIYCKCIPWPESKAELRMLPGGKSQ